MTSVTLGALSAEDMGEGVATGAGRCGHSPEEDDGTLEGGGKVHGGV